MKVKMLIEAKERAREEIRLQTAIPNDAESLKKWMESWISKKELKQWVKSDWPSGMLGEKRPGQILRAVYESASGEKPLGGSLMALRSYVPDNAGGRKRLPLVLFGRLGDYVDLGGLRSLGSVDPDTEKEIEDAIRNDAWGPISVWHPSLNEKQQVGYLQTLDTAVRYSRRVFRGEQADESWPPFSETEFFKR